MIKALVFGGAFNPPTIAHIALAEEAMHASMCDKVIFVPSKMSYVLDEQGKDSAFDDETRLEMLSKIAFDRPWMDVDPGEIKAETQPRTYETLCRLRQDDYQIKLLFGSDKLKELEHGWKYVDRICREFGIVCMSRREDSASKIIREDPYLRTLSPYITVIRTSDRYRDVSSTEARKLFAQLKKNPGDVRLQDRLKVLVPAELDGLKEYL